MEDQSNSDLILMAGKVEVDVAASLRMYAGRSYCMELALFS